MASFAEKIQSEIAQHEAAIATLKAHLASGESWLQTEADAIWNKVKGWFSHPASIAPVAAAPTSTPPAAS